MFASQLTATVEVRVDGRPHGQASLGVPRPDLSGRSDLAAAPVCGFEFWIHPDDLKREPEQVTIDAEVKGTDGGQLRLGPFLVPVVHSDTNSRRSSDFSSSEAQVLRLRKRIARIRSHTRPRAEGLNLLAYSHRLELSGAPLYLVTLLRHVQRDNVRCTVVSPEDGPLRRELEFSGIPVHISHANRFPDPVAYESKLWALTAWAARQSFDVVHVNAIDAFLGVDLAERLALPAVWAIHESFPPDEWIAVNRWSPHHYVRERLLNGFRTASTVLLATESTRQQFLPFGPPERMTLMPYGIDLERIAAYRATSDPAALRERFGIPKEATVVLSLATIEPRKAQTSLAMAFSNIAEAHPHALLVMVGDTGLEWTAEFTSALREFLTRSGLDSRAVVVPVTSDPYQWLAVADVFVLASEIESLPLIVLEAMAFEVPTLATAVSGIPELVRDGQNGFLCQPRDVGELSNALESLLSLGPEERQAVARAGAQEVRHRHDIRGYAARYGSIVTALAENPRAVPAPAIGDDGSVVASSAIA